jgi:hypothetical protein
MALISMCKAHAPQLLPLAFPTRLPSSSRAGTASPAQPALECTCRTLPCSCVTPSWPLASRPLPAWCSPLLHGQTVPLSFLNVVMGCAYGSIVVWLPSTTPSLTQHRQHLNCTEPRCHHTQHPCRHSGSRPLAVAPPAQLVAPCRQSSQTYALN